MKAMDQLLQATEASHQAGKARSVLKRLNLLDEFKDELDPYLYILKLSQNVIFEHYAPTVKNPDNLGLHALVAQMKESYNRDMFSRFAIQLRDCQA